MLPAATLQGSGSEDEPRGGRGQRQRADEPLLLCRLGFQREPRFPMTTTQILLAKGELTESAREGRRSLKVQFKSRGPVLARGLPFPLASSRAPPAPVPTRPPTPRGQPVLRIGSAFRRGQGQRGGREDWNQLQRKDCHAQCGKQTTQASPAHRNSRSVFRAQSHLWGFIFLMRD